MPGDLVHVEMPAKDGARARRFYSALLGWKFGDPAMAEMDYCMTENSKPAVAVYTDGEQRGPIVYFEVPDVDAAMMKAREIGGTAAEKMPVPGQGWFSSCVDTEGNPFRLWQTDASAPAPAGQPTAAAAGKT